jgi:hypothetical protein
MEMAQRLQGRTIFLRLLEAVATKKRVELFPDTETVEHAGRKFEAATPIDEPKRKIRRTHGLVT